MSKLCINCITPPIPVELTGRNNNPKDANRGTHKKPRLMEV